MSGNVLRWDATGAFGGQLLIAQYLFRREHPVPVGVKISAIAAEHEHQQGFSIHPRRTDLSLFQLSDRGVECLLQVHVAITMRPSDGARLFHGQIGWWISSESRLTLRLQFRASVSRFDNE